MQDLTQTAPIALQHALFYLSLGFVPVQLHGVDAEGRCTCGRGEGCPEKSRGKHPVSKRWQAAGRPSAADLYAMWEEAPLSNVGIRTGDVSGIFVIDVDSGGLEPMRRLIAEHGGEWPRTRTVRTGSGMWHFYFRIPEGMRVTNSSKGLPAGVDVRGNGGQVVAPPSRTAVGEYVTADESLPTDPPAWLVQILAAQSHDETPLIDGPVVKREPTASERAYEQNLVGKQLERLQNLKNKPWQPDDAWDNTCYEVACHLIEMANAPFSRLTREEAHRLFMDSAPRDDKWDEREAKWASALRTSGNKAKVDTPSLASVSLAQLAGEAMPGGGLGAAFSLAAPVASSEIREQIGRIGGIEIVGDDGPANDASVAARFCSEALYGRAVWSRQLKAWMIWGGEVWREGSIHDVREMFRRWVLSNVENAPDEDAGKFWSRYASVSRLKNIPELAIGMMSVDHSIFDRHADLLVAGNGVVDLRTGQLQPFDPALLMTKRTNVDYDPDATSPDWDMVLQALPEEVAAWMQVRFGQAASGLPPEDDTLVICKGGGANAKTTMLDAVREALGGYATVVSERLLLGSHKDHPTEMTDLYGVRFALLEELPENGHLAIKRLKSLIGTEQITARRMYSNSMTWQPTHSLFVTTNYTPVVTETDHGTWRRLAMVTFPYRYVDTPSRPGERRADPTLRSRMRAAAQGQLEAVLAWLVKGAMRWYADGSLLRTRPAAVVADTDDWRGESDAIFAYAAARVEPDPHSLVLYRELYDDFTSWLAARGQAVWSERLFTERLLGHVALPGIERTRRRSLEGVSRRPGDFVTDAGSGQPVSMIAGLRFREDAEAISKTGTVTQLATRR